MKKRILFILLFCGFLLIFKIQIDYFELVVESVFSLKRTTINLLLERIIFEFFFLKTLFSLLFPWLVQKHIDKVFFFVLIWVPRIGFTSSRGGVFLLKLHVIFTSIHIRLFLIWKLSYLHKWWKRCFMLYFVNIEFIQ